jgi:hypothetical protein
MTYEMTDTNSQFNDNIPDGTYDFEVVSVVRKEIKGKRAYEWSLNYDGGGGKVLTWPNQVGLLLALLGAKEDATKKGHYLWETDMMVGKTFKATISHDPDKKDPTKFYQNMKDFKASAKSTDEVPF